MMRRKLFISILLLIIGPSVLSARMLPDGWVFDRFRFGVEWGYTQSFYLHRDYNFISEEGYRVFEQTSGFAFHPNAQILGQVGFSLSERVQLSVLGGYMGVGRANRLFPVLLRLSIFPETLTEDGFFYFAQGGPAWHPKSSAGEGTAILTSAGAGYRLRLSTDCCLDLLVGIKYLADHPAIPNPDGPGKVPGRNIRKNYAGYCALDFSIAISF